jgi:hypothetical protein
MDLKPLLCVVRAMERPLLFLIRGLLLVVSVVSVISAILAISSVSHVGFPVVLLLLCGRLAMRLKKLSPGFRSLNACVSDREQIGHHLGLLHGDLLHSLDVTDSITKGVDILDVLDIWDDIPSIAEIFHIVPEALIMLFPGGLQSLSSRWMLVHIMEVPDEHGT